MARTIELAASLPAAPERLFDMYLDPALRLRHGITRRDLICFRFSVSSLQQRSVGSSPSCRAQAIDRAVLAFGSLGESDLDSTLILTFLPEKDGGRIELVQVNVVETDFAGVCHGWEKFYWTPWRA